MASTSCTQQFDAEQPNVLLNIRRSLSLLMWNVPSIEDCKRLCLLRETCRSVTFQETASKYVRYDLLNTATLTTFAYLYLNLGTIIFYVVTFINF